MEKVKFRMKMSPQQAGKLYMHREQLIDEVDQLKDLVRFLSETWSSVDSFVYANCTGEQLMKYPVVQGTRNQMNLTAIGKQKYDIKKCQKAIKIILAA